MVIPPMAPLFTMHGYNLNFIFFWNLSVLVFALCGLFILTTLQQNHYYINFSATKKKPKKNS